MARESECRGAGRALTPTRAPKPRRSVRGPVEHELAQLDNLDIAGLRARWFEVTGRDAPAGFRTELLKRALGHEMQVKHYGGLSLPLKRRLRILCEAAREDRFDESLGLSVLKTGTVLVRVWQSQSHRVTVAEKGFLWNGETFRTLSAIAKVISGQSWNGWVFFGIKRLQSRNKNALKGALTRVDEVKNA